MTVVCVILDLGTEAQWIFLCTLDCPAEGTEYIANVYLLLYNPIINFHPILFIYKRIKVISHFYLLKEKSSCRINTFYWKKKELYGGERDLTGNLPIVLSTKGRR